MDVNMDRDNVIDDDWFQDPSTYSPSDPQKTEDFPLDDGEEASSSSSTPWVSFTPGPNDQEEDWEALEKVDPDRAPHYEWNPKRKSHRQVSRQTPSSSSSMSTLLCHTRVHHEKQKKKKKGTSSSLLRSALKNSISAFFEERGRGQTTSAETEDLVLNFKNFKLD